ncbi:MAG: NAD-dependent epimerase/dehydratase family protein, partial [Nitrospirae bacterium]
MEGVVDPGFWVGRRVFLTGHTGFKGSWLALWLAELGAEVHGYSLPPPTRPSLFGEARVAADLASDQRGDVRHRRRLARALAAARPEVVLHLAAQPLVAEGLRDPVGTYAANLMGTVHLLEAVRATPGVRACLVVTSDKCYAPRGRRPHREGDPLGAPDPYG